nr:protein EXPORTIN 1A isoform X2 [Ipomoea trifida]
MSLPPPLQSLRWSAEAVHPVQGVDCSSNDCIVFRTLSRVCLKWTFGSLKGLSLSDPSMAAEKLRDLSQPIDVALLDATVNAFYGTGSKEERAAADHILRDLQNNPDMWLQVVRILSSTQNLNTKFFSLQVLEGVIKYKWNALPTEERDGMKNYISDLIVKLSSDEATLRRESEFQLIHELCLYVLSASQRTELIRATLATLHAFLSWIPLGYIFESPLLETLLKFFPLPAYRNLTLQCLTEVAALNFGDFYNVQYVKMYTIFMAQLQNILPPNTNIPEAYAHGNNDEQETVNALLMGLEYLINISYVDDTEVFKVCLDYWNSLVLELYEAHHNADNPAMTASLMGLQVPMLPGMVDGLAAQLMQRRQLFAGPMSKLRLLMICRMAKPEEVLIVEDENGNIVRETMKDNDVLVQYKIMRETLIYLSHLDHEDTEKQMLKKLSKQLDGEDWSWNNLNTLCWAIGSISGSMVEEQENRFLVMVIRDLLNLCEITKGKDNKAVIASNIMYVVGQYPRFLRAHWKFLKTVVNKLFEFMHESHPGVQDMACDTFLKIVQKCKRKFVTVQASLLGENEPFVSELLTSLPTTIVDLEPHQIHSFYESVGHMIQAESDIQKRDEYLQRMYSELISVSIAQGGPFASRTSVVKLLRSVKRETLKLIDTFLDKAEGQPHIGKQFVPPMMDPVLGDYARNVPDARESEVLSLFATIINKYKGAMLEDVPRIFEAVFQCTLEMITKNFEDYPEHRLKFFSLLRAIATHCFPALIRLSTEQVKLVMDSIIWAFRHTERNIAETGLLLLLEMLKNFQASEFCNQFYRTYFLTIEQEIFAILTDTFHKPGFKLHVLVLQHLFCLVESGPLTEPLWDATVPYAYPNNAMFVREFTIKLLSSSFPNMTASEVTQFVSGLFESTNDPSVFKNHIRDFIAQSKEFSAQDSSVQFPSCSFTAAFYPIFVISSLLQDNKDLYAEEAAAQRERDRQRMLSIPGLIAPNEIQDEMVDL